MIGELLSCLLRINLAAAAAILLVLALRRPVREMFGAGVAYALWTVVPMAVTAGLLPTPESATPISPIVLSASGVVQRTMPEPLGTDLAAWLLASLWLAGVLTAATLLVLRQRRYMAALGRLEPAEGGAQVFRAQNLGVGPAVVGAFRPRIVTPADFETRFDAQEQEVILAHESAHLITGDARINALVAAAQCLAWFNPLVHLAAYRLRIDQELACDAAVLTQFPHARRLYAEVLLKTQLATQALPIGCHWPAAAQHPLKERIVMLKSPLPAPSRRLAGLVAVAALSLGGACTAWAANGPPPALVTQPDWMERPTGEDLARHYPAEAARQGIAGRAVIDCRVTVTGRLEACAVVMQDPVQYDFGVAALQLAQHFQMRPMARDGAPTAGGQVRIPIRFSLPEVAPKTN